MSYTEVRKIDSKIVHIDFINNLLTIWYF